MLKVNVLKTDLTLAHPDEVYSKIATAEREPICIATVNPEFLLESLRNRTFRTALTSMTFCTVDGSGVYFLLRIMKRLRKVSEVPNILHGSDLTEELFKVYSDGSKSFYFLGGKPGVTKEVANGLRKRFPSISIVGTDDGGKIDPSSPVTPEQTEKIRNASPDILLVGFGAPKQELWIHEARHTGCAPVMIGIGGTFDFYVSKKRAPKVFRALHLEWLYRVFSEHGHWKRAIRAAVWFPIRSAFWLLTSR